MLLSAASRMRKTPLYGRESSARVEAVRCGESVLRRPGEWRIPMRWRWVGGFLEGGVKVRREGGELRSRVRSGDGVGDERGLAWIVRIEARVKGRSESRGSRSGRCIMVTCLGIGYEVCEAFFVLTAYAGGQPCQDQ